VSADQLPYEGAGVRLRDVTLADADVLDAWNDAVEPGSFNDFGLHHRVPREGLLKGMPLRDENRGTLIVERLSDGLPIGSVSWRRVTVYGPSPGSDAWQIGIELIPAARGQGHGSAAQRLIADWLFAATTVNRVEASTDIENIPEQRALEKAGYVREGVIRGCQLRAGTLHDLAYYSRIRSD